VYQFVFPAANNSSCVYALHVEQDDVQCPLTGGLVGEGVMTGGLTGDVDGISVSGALVGELDG
jgi:hypothetical protein